MVVIRFPRRSGWNLAACLWHQVEELRLGSFHALIFHTLRTSSPHMGFSFSLDDDFFFLNRPPRDLESLLGSKKAITQTLTPGLGLQPWVILVPHTGGQGRPPFRGALEGSPVFHLVGQTLFCLHVRPYNFPPLSDTQIEETPPPWWRLGEGTPIRDSSSPALQPAPTQVGPCMWPGVLQRTGV